MTNKEKWKEKLKPLSHYEAWRYIWGRNNLTSDQRKALFKFWEELQNEKQEEIYEKWGKPEAWLPED
jgi:hypothetical protein